MSRFNQSSLLAAGERVTEEQLADEVRILAFERSVSRMNRRNFVTAVGAAGAVAAAATLTGCDPQYVASTPAANPVADTLNFALNLEYLEANFYSYIVTGIGLPTADPGNGPGPITGGAQVTFVNPVVASLAMQLYTNEREHVEFLRQAVLNANGIPISQPALNLAAMGKVTNDATFLAMSRQLETVGVSAYAGAAKFLVANPTALTAAAQIADTEGQHEGFLRQLCITLGVVSPAVDSMDLPPTATQVFNTSPTTGLNPIRTTSQVLQIVYGSTAAGTTKGGFFPAGFNGNIVST